MKGVSKNKTSEHKKSLSLTFTGPCIANVFLSSTNKMQCYTIFVYSCHCSTRFEWFFRLSSGAKKLYMQHRVLIKLVYCDC